MNITNHLVKVICVLFIIFITEQPQVGCAKNKKRRDTTASTTTESANGATENTTDDGSDSSKETSTKGGILKPDLSSLVPDCVFGVDSVSFIQITSDKPFGTVIDDAKDKINVDSESVSFVIHGFVSEANTTNNYAAATNWVNNYNTTVFLLNWKDAACNSGGFSITNLLAYGSAVKNVKSVAERVAKFIDRLINDYGKKLEDFTLVGHSLGAHLAGFVGKIIQEKHNKAIPYIIGLDPAGPLYQTKSCEERLCDTDANRVEIFHTSGLGIPVPIGDIDIYFNFGTNQPGCLEFVCSHSRAVEFFALSLMPDCVFIGKSLKGPGIIGFPLQGCTPDTCCNAGLDALHSNLTGVFNVMPLPIYPYCVME